MRPTAIASRTFLTGLVFLAGCTTFKPGGSEWSDDAHTWYSTPQQPTTVSVMDTRTGQALWTYEVPVNRQLSIQFFKNVAPDNLNTPDEMRWDDLAIGTVFASLQNTLPVPNDQGRRIEWVVRARPEFPKDATGSPAVSSIQNPPGAAPPAQQSTPRKPGYQDTNKDY